MTLTKYPWRSYAFGKSLVIRIVKKIDLIIMPKTPLGKWSAGFIVAMVILFIIGTSLSNSLYSDIPAGITIWSDIAARPFLALSMLAGIILGISAAISGALAIAFQKEHVPLVYFSTSIGALLVVFFAVEILCPH
jgi:hypothetical protein